MEKSDLAIQAPILASHTLVNLDKILTRKAKKEFASLIQPRGFDMESELVSWQLFYEQVFGIKKDFLRRAKGRKKSEREAIVVIAEVGAEEVYEKYKKLLTCWSKYSLADVRDPMPRVDASYAVYLMAHGRGITLKERLLQGLKHFYETGDFLDKETTTVCKGSPFRDNTWPHVSIFGKMLAIDSQETFGDGHCLRYPKVNYFPSLI